MKKLVFSLFALLGMTAAASAQTITVADVEALPGETVKATLVISDPTDSYTGFQLAIQFPETGFSVAANAATGWPGLITNGAMTDGKVKFSAAHSAPFSSASIDVEFTVDGSATLGEKDVTITDIQFEKTGSEDKISDVAFKVNVVAAHTVVLDETSTEAPAAATGVNVKVLRTINAGEWSTICLPFAMTAEQLTAAFGAGVKLGEFKGTDPEFDEADNCTAIKVKFENATAIEANHPYIIKVESNVTEFAVDGVDINADEDEAVVEFDNGKTGRNRQILSGFYGVYRAGSLIEEDGLFLSEGKFWYSTGTAASKAFRANFYFIDVLANKAAAAPVYMVFGSETTGIAQLAAQKTAAGQVFNLNGQRVGKAGKGLYIVGGKKVIVK